MSMLVYKAHYSGDDPVNDVEGAARTALGFGVAAVGPRVLPMLLPGLAVGLPGIVIGSSVASAAASLVDGSVSFSGLVELRGEDWKNFGKAAAFGGGTTMAFGMIGRAVGGLEALRFVGREDPAVPLSRIRELMRTSPYKEFIEGERYRGMDFFSRFGGAAGFVADKIYDSVADTVPTVDVSAGRMLSGMPSEFLMPCPPRLSPAVEGEYLRAPQVVVDCFRGFVADAEARVPEVVAPVVAETGEDSGIATYEVARVELAADQAELSRSEGRVPGLVQQGAGIAARGRQAITDAVVRLNRMASTGPPQGRSQDEWSLEYLHAMLDSVQEAVGNTANGLAGIGGRIADLSPGEAGVV
ncbi:hypothetical protein ACWIGW_39610 [Nocardia brasiliensis]